MEALCSLDVLQEVPELVVHERMSQGKGVKGMKEKEKVIGWSTEEMREKPNVALEEDSEEMRKWRGLSQSEMDQCWKNLVEWKRKSWTSTRSKKAKERPSLVEVPRWNEGGCAKSRNTESGEKIAGQENSVC